MKADIETIKAHCIIDDQGCWLWTRSLDTGGYAQIMIPSLGVGNKGHRITYTLLKGPIPDNLPLDHLCRNTRCVNPDHVEPVTAKENIYRGESLTNELKSRTHCVRGHEFNEENTYITKRNSRHCIKCINLRKLTADYDIYVKRISSPRNTNSGYYGVYNSGGRWRASVKVNDVTTVFGSFETKEEAYAARMKYEEEVNLPRKRAVIDKLSQPPEGSRLTSRGEIE